MSPRLPEPPPAMPRLYVNAYHDGYRCAWCSTRDGADSEARALKRRRVGVWRVKHG
jgi:hypothetical protein